MQKMNTVVAVYGTHPQAEEALRAFQHTGFDMKKLSIVGKDYHTEEHVIGFYNAGDRMKFWGKRGAFWGTFWGMLFGSALFLIPGVGHLMVLGPLAGWIVGALGEGRRDWGSHGARRRPLQHRYPEGQHPQVRDCAQSRQVRRCRACTVDDVTSAKRIPRERAPFRSMSIACPAPYDGSITGLRENTDGRRHPHLPP